MLQTNLFGITVDDSLKELRRRYYDLALLCHPDRGGSKDDMLVVQRTYEALKAAMEHQAEGECKREYLETKLRELEKEQTTTTEIPCVRAIFDEVHDHFNQRFNDAFDAQTATIPDTTEPQPLDFVDPYVEQGYGDYMIIREATNNTSTFTEDQLTYNPDDMTEAYDTNLPSLNTIPLEPESTSRDTTPLSTPISSIVPYSHQTAAEPWARDAHSTTWTRTTHITDFGTFTSVPQAIPLTDYGLSFKPSTCGKFKSWSNTYLPNVREETSEDIYAEMNDESITTNNGDSTDEHLYYESCAPVITSTLRRRRGKPRSIASKWIIECEPNAYNTMPYPADRRPLSDVVADAHKEEDPLYFHQKLLNWLWSSFVNPPNECMDTMDETDTQESCLVHVSSNMSSEKLKKRLKKKND